MSFFSFVPVSQNLAMFFELCFIDIVFFFRLVIKWRFVSRVSDQMIALMSGTNEFVPQNLLSIFDPNELEVSRKTNVFRFSKFFDRKRAFFCSF